MDSSSHDAASAGGDGGGALSYTALLSSLSSCSEKLRKHKGKGIVKVLPQVSEDMDKLCLSVRRQNMNSISPSSRVYEAQYWMNRAVVERQALSAENEAQCYIAAGSIWIAVERERRAVNFPTSDDALARSVLCYGMACNVLLACKYELKLSPIPPNWLLPPSSPSATSQATTPTIPNTITPSFTSPPPLNSTSSAASTTTPTTGAPVPSTSSASPSPRANNESGNSRSNKKKMSDRRGPAAIVNPQAISRDGYHVALPSSDRGSSFLSTKQPCPHLAKVWSICHRLATVLAEFSCLEMASDYHELAAVVVSVAATAEAEEECSSGDDGEDEEGALGGSRTTGTVGGIGGGGGSVASGASPTGATSGTGVPGGWESSSEAGTNRSLASKPRGASSSFHVDPAAANRSHIMSNNTFSPSSFSVLSASGVGGHNAPGVGSSSAVGGMGSGSLGRSVRNTYNAPLKNSSFTPTASFNSKAHAQQASMASASASQQHIPHKATSSSALPTKKGRNGCASNNRRDEDQEDIENRRNGGVVPGFLYMYMNSLTHCAETLSLAKDYARALNIIDEALLRYESTEEALKERLEGACWRHVVVMANNISMLPDDRRHRRDEGINIHNTCDTAGTAGGQGGGVMGCDGGEGGDDKHEQYGRDAVNRMLLANHLEDDDDDDGERDVCGRQTVLEMGDDDPSPVGVVRGGAITEGDTAATPPITTAPHLTQTASSPTDNDNDAHGDDTSTLLLPASQQQQVAVPPAASTTTSAPPSRRTHPAHHLLTIVEFESFVLRLRVMKVCLAVILRETDSIAIANEQISHLQQLAETLQTHRDAKTAIAFGRRLPFAPANSSAAATQATSARSTPPSEAGVGGGGGDAGRQARQLRRKSKISDALGRKGRPGGLKQQQQYPPSSSSPITATTTASPLLFKGKSIGGEDPNSIPMSRGDKEDDATTNISSLALLLQAVVESMEWASLPALNTTSTATTTSLLLSVELAPRQQVAKHTLRRVEGELLDVLDRLGVRSRDVSILCRRMIGSVLRHPHHPPAA